MGPRWLVVCVSTSLACSAPSTRGGSLSSPAAVTSDQAMESPDGVSTPPADAAVSLSPDPVGFVTHVLETSFYAEGAAVADLDGDGALDLVAGPLWYAGPTFTTRRSYTDAPTLALDSYSSFFLVFTDDINADGRPDIVAVAGPNGETGNGGTNARWYENPGPSPLPAAPGDDVAWTSHLLFEGTVSNESPVLADITGDDAPELVFMTNQQLGYATRGAEPTRPWVFTAISDAMFPTPYVHGLGVGDVSGDGRPDVLEKSGWWEQPATADSWLRHEFDFALGGQGGAQMLVMDVDGDGDGDVISSLNAHGYGLAWFEQRTPDDFVPHELLPSMPAEMNVSQLHALAAGDINGDGRTDFAVGKRYYAHPSTSPDPGTLDPALVYWFEHTRDQAQRFLPHLVHDASGVGCNFVVRDVDADGKVDLFATNKHGAFVHLQQ